MASKSLGRASRKDFKRANLGGSLFFPHLLPPCCLNTDMIRVRNTARANLIQQLGCQMGKSEAHRARNPLDITQQTKGDAVPSPVLALGPVLTGVENFHLRLGGVCV